VSELEPDAGEEGEVGALLLEPLAALPVLDDGGVALLELLEPPDAGALGALDEELELLSDDIEPETDPDGAVLEPDGEVVEPADEDEPGARAPVLPVPAPSRSQPVSRLAPSARDTAAARIESLMCGLRGWGTMNRSKVRAI
jgi:hypothetical protein